MRVTTRDPEITVVDAASVALRELAARHPERYPVLLDSAAEGPLARYSILCGAPRAALWRDAEGKLGGEGIEVGAGSFLDHLEAWWRRDAVAPRENHGLPFVDGWIVYAGYELAAEVERSLKLPRHAAPYSAFALRVDRLLVHDLGTRRTSVITPAGNAAARNEILADLDAIARDGQQLPDAPLALASLREEAPEKFIGRVRSALEHIAAGDVYQANLSRRWNLTLAEDQVAARVFAALRRSNPAPFAAAVSWRGLHIESSSPERLLSIDGREIATRPIAGTRPRRGSAQDDRRMTEELIGHPKERAEHVMLIDLERNDLGRVCEPGSVRVDEFMVTESYTHVHHIVSNVRGRLRADASPIDALRALFPGGTITGCPKVRCMQIIAALEGEGRGAYTGSLGWLGTDGNADFNILIRTMMVMGREIELRAGAGIVADSDPVRELDETRAKARGMLAAFTLAEPA